MISNVIIWLAQKINWPAKDEKHPIDTQAREQVWNLSIFQFPLFCDSVFYVPMYIGHCQDLLENSSTDIQLKNQAIPTLLLFDVLVIHMSVKF